MERTKNGNWTAFLPLIAFMVIYVGAGAYFQAKGVDFAFYQFPSVGAMLIAIFLAFLPDLKKDKFSRTLNAFIEGIANNNMVTMLLIYLIAASMATAAGFNMSAVNFIPYVWYAFLLCFFGILSIFIPFADGALKKIS